MGLMKVVVTARDTNMEPSYQEYRQNLLQRNSKFAKPNWKITTFKSDKEEEDFSTWVKTNKVPFDKEDPYPDYDMRGFYSALQTGDERAKTAVNSKDKLLHFPDVWKTPYHESFSNESQYATENAPSWVGDDKVGWKLLGLDGIVYKDETIYKK